MTTTITRTIPSTQMQASDVRCGITFRRSGESGSSRIYLVCGDTAFVRCVESGQTRLSMTKAEFAQLVRKGSIMILSYE